MLLLHFEQSLHYTEEQCKVQVSKSVAALEFYSYGAKKREDSDIPSDKVLLDVNVIL